MAPDGRPTRRPWLSAVAVSVPVALLLCLTTAGTVGPAGTLLLTVITTAAVAALLWAVIGARQQRRVYEDRLTAWAAERPRRRNGCASPVSFMISSRTAWAWSPCVPPQPLG
ncbi:hypothetical protein GCM10029963_18710 [Micromonospora andamanensis]